MALRDFIKKVAVDKNNEELKQEVIDTYEHNATVVYPNKSTAWHIRITADQLDMKKDDLCEILDQHYGSEEGEK